MTRNEELLDWWSKSLYDLGYEAQFFEPIYDYALHKLTFAETDPRDGAPFVDKAIDAIASRLTDCPARCPAQLRQWAYHQIDTIAAKVHHAEGVRPARRGDKPFEYEQHGDVAIIELYDGDGTLHPWTVPASSLEWARSIWPVYIRFMPDGRPYVAKKAPVVHPDGKKVQRILYVHRLFLGQRDRLRVVPRDGSYLNYVNGNLSLACDELSILLDDAHDADKPAPHDALAYRVPWEAAEMVATKSLLLPAKGKRCPTMAEMESF